ncbi:uncharacterized protein TNCT_399671 [Trichonephila clavata]|uniref:Uncharacterized protein n=1 Tax=Trichonephila clavata TaxID=2740835 RepID=A0A8X6KM06_TRICU|nr:uncharacterized protein TNCT_399671 [Trichonephila clavata]
MACKRKKCSPVGTGFINSAINNLPFEMHLPGHSFTGPGTQLLWGKTRLNPDLTYKGWSRPINRVNETAYRYDVCYLKNKDTKTRNEVCDKNMIEELDSIGKPTIRERMERVIVKPIIKAKKTFGMGGIKMKCRKCKKETDFKNIEENTSKNNRRYIVGNCSICNTKQARFLGAPTKSRGS